VCGRLMSPAHETQSMREIRLLRGRLPRKGGGLTGMHYEKGCHHGHDRLVIGFTAICAISVYHH
jgi:hypothetical protein